MNLIRARPRGCFPIVPVTNELCDEHHGKKEDESRSRAKNKDGVDGYQGSNSSGVEAENASASTARLVIAHAVSRAHSCVFVVTLNFKRSQRALGRFV